MAISMADFSAGKINCPLADHISLLKDLKRYSKLAWAVNSMRCCWALAAN